MTPAAQQLAAAMASAKPGRRRKYGNEPIVLDGIRFDSKAEAKRWGELRTLERAGLIAGLRRQPRYALHAPNGEVIGLYVPDFDYLEAGRGVVSEDVKGKATALYRWKATHFKAEYGRPVVEIPA